MAHPRKSHERGSTAGTNSGECSEKDTSADQIDPGAFGLTKAAYAVAVGETLDLLSISRTSLYAAVKRGDLKRVKFGKKTLFYAADLASFLTKLRLLEQTSLCETFTLPLHAGRLKAREILNGCPVGGCMTIVENWRRLPDGQIEFTMRRLPTAD